MWRDVNNRFEKKIVLFVYFYYLFIYLFIYSNLRNKLIAMTIILEITRLNCDRTKGMYMCVNYLNVESI